jgi:uncharacterized protein
MASASTTDAAVARGRLERVLHGIGPLAVAVSGGVDSMTLAHVAHAAVGSGLRIFHAGSAAVPPEATERVRRHADRQGWDLAVIDAGEVADPRYAANPVDRCFFCKTDLYAAIRLHTELPMASGANLDDLGDYRPGLLAAERHGVRHPLVEAGIGKSTVRAIAAAMGLDDLADLPASPCLSSRIETGLRVTPERLALVLEVERLLDRRLPGVTRRCRLRAGGVVVELDADRMPSIDMAALGDDIAGIARAHGIEGPVGFAPYRRGSAFLHGR